MSNLHSIPLVAALLVTAFAIATAGPVAAAESGPHDPAPRIAAQRAAMAPLSSLDGEWRGTVTVQLPSGETREMVHTERVGNLLDGSIKLIEGRAYGPDGIPAFNAFAIISYDPTAQTYNFRSYAYGQAGDFPLEATDDGFVWESPAGPATMRYTAVVRDGRWTEVGERIVPGQDPVRVVSLDLERIGDSDWPAAGAVPAE